MKRKSDEITRKNLIDRNTHLLNIFLFTSILLFLHETHKDGERVNYFVYPLLRYTTRQLWLYLYTTHVSYDSLYWKSFTFYMTIIYLCCRRRRHFVIYEIVRHSQIIYLTFHTFSIQTTSANKCTYNEKVLFISFSFKMPITSLLWARYEGLTYWFTAIHLTYYIYIYNQTQSIHV